MTTFHVITEIFMVVASGDGVVDACVNGGQKFPIFGGLKFTIHINSFLMHFLHNF